MINVLEGINPVTRILGLILLTTPLLMSVDLVSAAAALGFTLLAAPLCGVGWFRLVRRGWPVLLAAPLAAIPMALYGRPEGETYFQFLMVHVTDNSLSLAAASSSASRRIWGWVSFKRISGAPTRKLPRSEKVQALHLV